MLRVFPYAGIKFMMYEQFKLLVPSSYGQKSEFIAGSLAGVVSVLVTYPFDLLRVRLAFDTNRLALSGIVKQIIIEPNPTLHLKPNSPFGILNFYTGVVPTIMGMIPYAGVSFYTYGSLKTFAKQYQYCTYKEDPNKLNPVSTLACGAISGIAAQTCSYPFEVIRRHMQVAVRAGDVHKSVIGTTRDIISKRGIAGLFVGLGIGYIKVVPMFAVSFYSYEYLLLKLGIDKKN